MVGVLEGVQYIPTGVHEIDVELGGGIAVGSLVFIEGQSETGKSVLAQQFAHGALLSGENSAAYYTTDSSVKNLIAQMNAVSLPTLDYFLTDRLRVYPLRFNASGAKEALWCLIEHLARLPERFKLVVVDSVTLPMTHLDPVTLMDFLYDCKNLCKQRSIILVADSHAFKKGVLARIFSLCDTYFTLKSEYMRLTADEVGKRLVRVLEAPRLHGLERKGKEGLKFEIKPGSGIQVLPFGKITT